MSLKKNKGGFLMLKILVIGSKKRVSFKQAGGVEVLTMKSVEEKDLETIAKLSPDLIFLSRYCPKANSFCLQGEQILPLLCKYVPGVPIIGVGNWKGKKIDKNFFGIEAQERFYELFKEFLP